MFFKLTRSSLLFIGTHFRGLYNSHNHSMLLNLLNESGLHQIPLLFCLDNGEMYQA